jgi:uncharacterized protein
MSSLQQLYRLQQVDLEIRAKKQRLGEVLRAQKETEELIAARTRLETAESALATWQKQRNELNRELESLNSKAKQTENRLYSGLVKNPKEMADLEQSLAALSRRREALEEEVLEAMIMIEDAEGERETAAATHDRIKSEWETNQQNLKQEQNQLALALNELMEQSKTLRGRINADLLSQYDRLSQQKNGEALALLKLNRCQGCQLTVSTNIAKQVQQGQLVNCGSCGRILLTI